MNIEDMSPEDLYKLGKKIGKMGTDRPDITHKIFMGIRKGVESWSESSGQFGDFLWALQRHWHHDIANPETSPPIPFDREARPSGIGLSSWKKSFENN